MSLEATKAAKKLTYEVLPKAQPFKEDPQFAICHTTEDLASLAEESHDIPAQSLLRCAIEELGSKNEKATVEAIFQLLETRFPWILSETEQQNEVRNHPSAVPNALLIYHAESSLGNFVHDSRL